MLNSDWTAGRVSGPCGVIADTRHSKSGDNVRRGDTGSSPSDATRLFLCLCAVLIYFNSGILEGGKVELICPKLEGMGHKIPLSRLKNDFICLENGSKLLV